MTKYRDLLCKTHNEEIGSVVGCGLDRLSKHVNQNEINSAITFYQKNKVKIQKLAIGDRREAIVEYMSQQ